MAKIVLFEDDFQSYRAGDFPFEPFLGAMGEYHFRTYPGYAGQWYDPTPIMGSGGAKTWLILNQAPDPDQNPGRPGRKVIEYSVAPREGWDNLIMLATGAADWTDYSVGCQLRLLQSEGCAGLLFRYQNSLCFYALCFRAGRLELIKRDPQGVTVLAEKAFAHCGDQFYEFKVACQGRRITAWIDGAEQLAAEDDTYAGGKIAIAALAPVQFTAVRVESDAAANQEMLGRRRARQLDVAAERAEYPQPLLWKTIDLRDFGAGRNIRFGHLSGAGEWQIVLAQCQRRIQRDAFAQISCLTAIDLDGKVLWQLGEPHPDHVFLTADLPFQVYDIDGDGYDEVILAHDFKLKILDGRTGRVKQWTHTPRLNRQGYPFDRLNVDAIKLCDFSGQGRPTDILIKDRYQKVWVFDRALQFLWSYEAPVNTGHFPYTRDLNGDGREEMFIGYDLVDADGHKIWSLPVHTDHTDEIVIGRFDPARGELIGTASGSEGFMLADLQGNILVKRIIGHAQRISVGNYRPELSGLEICVTTYWGNQGIIYCYDCHGDLLWSDEPGTNGNVITPVNWTGDGRDLILLNANVARGGLIDGHNRPVVRFPADGHPELCAEVIDLTGDCRDELVVWDEQRMFIYTQDNCLEGQTVDRPAKYPYYNASNYRGEYSYRDAAPSK